MVDHIFPERDETVHETPRQEENDEDGAKSSLLKRRHLTPLAVSVSASRGAHCAGRQGSSVQQKDICPLGPDEKIYDLYQWDEVLQETGDGGKVVVCESKSPDSPKWSSQSPRSPQDSSRKYVMKIRSKESLDRAQMSDQFRKCLSRILNLPPHIGVLPIHEVLEDDRFYYIVMERASGGSFFDSLLQEFGDGVMPASSLRKLTEEILQALGHVHMQGILHRDVKPDNLVFQTQDDPMSGKVNHVSLIDFDHAEPDWTPGSRSSQSSWCGTVRFSAPETFFGMFSQASDLYGVGVILYMLLAGRMPYEDTLFEEVLYRRSMSPTTRRFNWKGAVYQRMKEAKIDWECPPFPSQPLCRDFCQKLLAWEAEDRFDSAERALQHPWLTCE